MSCLLKASVIDRIDAHLIVLTTSFNYIFSLSGLRICTVMEWHIPPGPLFLTRNHAGALLGYHSERIANAFKLYPGSVS